MRELFIIAMFLLAACAPTVSDPVVVPEETPAAVAADESVTQPAVLTTMSGQIHGTLIVPAGSGAVPVALIIAGSGPTDRDGNTAGLPGANNSLRMLAEGLAEHGIASLRYDKRGIASSASSGGTESDLRFDHYVEDAAAWIRQLQEDPRFSRVTVIGHSEGSLIGMVAARRANADAFVSIAGAGRSAPEILREQLKPQLPEPLWTESERILEGLVAGKQSADVPASLVALYRPSVQPYLISWFAYDPAVEIAKLDMPVLLVQGTTDIQIGAADLGALRRAAPGAEAVNIEGMNHVLKMVEADRAKQIASYSDPALPISEELVDRIVGFIRTER